CRAEWRRICGSPSSACRHLLPASGEKGQAARIERAPRVSFAPRAGRRWPAGRMRGCCFQLSNPPA
ncbi:hypothetical protein CN138_15295, partial [Sinorhizobium meliloti]